jgi:hypothetical protein
MTARSLRATRLRSGYLAVPRVIVDLENLGGIVGPFRTLTTTMPPLPQRSAWWLGW